MNNKFVLSLKKAVVIIIAFLIAVVAIFVAVQNNAMGITDTMAKMFYSTDTSTTGNFVINDVGRISENIQQDLVWINQLIFMAMLLAVVLCLFYSIKKVSFFKSGSKPFDISICLIIFVIVSEIFIINPFGISKKIVENFNCNKVITVDDFINNSDLNAFDVKPDKTLVSINQDPWVSLNLRQHNLNLKDINSLKIVIDSVSIDDNIAEIYYIDNEGECAYTGRFYAVQGENVVKILHNVENVSLIRLDLTVEKAVEIKLNNVEINDGDTLFKDFASTVRYIDKYVAFMAILILCFVLGRKFSNKFKRKYDLYRVQLCFFAAFVFVIILNILLVNSVLSYILISALMVMYGALWNNKKSGKNYLYIFLFIVALTMPFLSMNGMNEYVGFIAPNTQKDAIINSWMMLWFVLSVVEITTICGKSEETQKTKLHPIDLIICVFVLYFIVHSVVYCIYNGASSLNSIIIFLKYNVWDYNFMFNSFLVMFVCIFLLCAGGKGLLYTGVGLAFIISVIGNYIKLVYQGTYLKFADFILLSELFNMVSAYIGKIGVVLIVVVLIGIIALIIIKRKHIAKILSLKTDKSVAIVAVAVVFAIVTNNMGYFKNLLQDNYSLYKPDNYNENSVKEIVSNYNHDIKDDNIKPDVILIMAESMFDVSRLPDVTFNMDCTENIRKFKVADVISPRFGGGTAAVEFEALTGLSNFFFVKDMVAYNMYFSKNVKVNSLASEFKNNGYETTAIHPNGGSFYKRDMVYDDMDFDKFYDINSFDIKEGDTINDGFVKDSLFFDKVKNTLEETDEPQFIFGVTIEGHSPYTDKFKNTDVKISSTKLNESELSDIQNFSQTIKDIDVEIGKLEEYVMNRERPTICYIWGDHLPSLSGLSSLEYVKGETYEKYRVPLVAFSNYKNIEVTPEEISPIQIATQILSDSNIAYSKYFDYIKSFRNTYPVIHKEFTPEDELKDYYSVVYDILKGKNYLVDY